MNMLIAALAFLGVSSTAAPIVGSTAPDFTGTTTTGETISLSQFENQKVILEWSNHGCPYVQKHYNSGNMQSVQKRTTAEGVVWITIISSAPGEQGYVNAAEADDLTHSRKAAPTYVVLDPEGEIGRLYAAKTTPHMFLIDEDQTLQYAGAIDSIPTANVNDIARAENFVMAAFRSLQNGQAVVTKQSQPYGCAVKYAS
ncbi:redoxin domain-containing protein [Parvularcula marina]|uniref:Thioredoxin family protein n=1 Tax=Parvularcula marina TaxID=2292771 RepID=A0A371RKC7_9PROT|nr:redoxin domain-containing protein [Parvularcula marina]RFB05894.1 thioredoxin family protein [Parvularcula marina]